MARPAFIALLAVAVVALAACGSSDDSADSRSDVSTTSGVIAPQGTTSVQGGATGATSTKRAHRKRTGKSQQQSDDKAGSGAPTAPQDQPAPQPSLSREQLKEVGRQQAKQARVLCKASTLEGLAQQYGIENADPDAVAKAYAAPYLAGVRDAVAAGCKAGLLEAK